MTIELSYADFLSFFDFLELSPCYFAVVRCELVHAVWHYMACGHCYQNIEMFSEILGMRGKLQIAVSWV